MNHSDNEQPAEVTYNGLHSWFQKVFKKSGWMILELDKGHKDSIKHFLNEIEHLERAIRHRLIRIQEQDRIDDLNILLANLKILKNHFNK